jgi:hypothetical protein
MHEAEHILWHRLQRANKRREHATIDLDAPLPALTREMVDSVSMSVAGQTRRVVVSCFTDYDRIARETQSRLTLSWVRVMKEQNIPFVLGICNRAATTYRDVQPLAAEHWGELFGGTLPQCLANARIGRAYYAQQFMQWGFDVIYSDPDVVFVRNPVPYFGALFQKHPAVDVLAMSDSNTGVYAENAVIGETDAHNVPRTIWQSAYPEVVIPQGYVRKREHTWRDTVADALLQKLASGDFNLGLEWPGNCDPFQFNTGFLYIRNTPRAAALLALWTNVLDTTTHNPTADDQKPFNDVLKNGSTYCATSPATIRPTLPCGGDSALNAVADNTACFGLLNLPQFANGFVYAGSRAHEQYGVVPFVFHATYTNDKVMKLQEEGFFP